MHVSSDYPDPAKDTSFWGVFWRYGLWLANGSSAATFDMEAILPSLPLQGVDVTIERLLGSLAPYLGGESEGYKKIEADLKVSVVGSLWSKPILQNCPLFFLQYGFFVVSA